MVSVPASTLKVSIPAPPVRISSPNPPVKVSLPSPPIKVSIPSPPLRVSLPVPPVIASFPVPPEMVEAIFGPVIVSLPVVPLIVTVSVPLVKELAAVMFVNVAVSPEPTLMIRLDVPAAVSLRDSVSPVNCKPVKVAVWLAPANSISSISSKLAAGILTKSVVVTIATVSVPPLDASVIASPESISLVPLNQ